MGVGGMLDKPDSCVVLVEPVHLLFVRREIRVHVATKDCPPVVVVLFDVRVEIELGNTFHDRVESSAVCCQHYYLCFVFRVFFLR